MTVEIGLAADDGDVPAFGRINDERNRAFSWCEGGFDGASTFDVEG